MTIGSQLAVFLYALNEPQRINLKFPALKDEFPF